LRTCRDLEGVEIGCIEAGVAIWRECRGEPGEAWVERDQMALEIHPLQAYSAIETDHLVESAMQVDHLL
jgi:hypothetical protein